MSLKKKLFDYFDNHPINDLDDNKYHYVRKHFKISLKTASKYWIQYKKQKGIHNNVSNINSKEDYVYNDSTYTISKVLDVEVKTKDDLVKYFDIDLNEFEIYSFACSKRDNTVKGEIKPLYSVRATLKPKKFNTNYEKQKEIILEELFDKAPDPKPIIYKNKDVKKYLYELDLFDVHFGKLAHKEEVGEDYNIEIATKRWFDAIESLLSRVNLNSIEKFLLPIGNDLIHIDNLINSTTAGTPQDTDGRFHKIIQAVKSVIIDTINSLTQIAPVDIICIPGNHDTLTSYMLTDIIAAYFNKNPYVVVYNDPSLRKYYKYGNVGLMFTHGDKEKFDTLGMIFAAENPKLWASTTQRYIKIGHKHHSRKQELNTQEFQGFTVQIIPSLSANDYWHYNKGFNSLRQAKAFLYDKDEGVISEMTYTVTE